MNRPWPVHLHAEPSRLTGDCERVLRARGILVTSTTTSSAEADTAQTAFVHAFILHEVPKEKQAAQLAERVAACARADTPPALFIPLVVSRNNTDEEAASISLLRARGAIVVRAPELWIECVILLASHGVPAGPCGAIVAQPGGWLAASTAALERRAESIGTRFSPVLHSRAGDCAADFVITDSQPGETSLLSSVLIVPLDAQGPVHEGLPSLSSLEGALMAAELAGQARLRFISGDGPAKTSHAPADAIDSDRFSNQLAKLGTTAGDHECKVLLSSYSVAITRQAVATTPSAATRIAKKAGYPVELKAWGAEQPSEAQGALVQKHVSTAADVRRAFSTICSACKAEAVIVRETPMKGREIRIHIRPVGAIGLVCFLTQRGQGEPVAGLAPLRPIDADSMAHNVVASRSGDKDPDWQALAKLLLHTSHMVAASSRIVSVELSRVIVGNEGQGALVVDARATLTAPS